MSWGYFVDLDVSLATDAYERILKKKPNDFALKPGWSGLEDRELEAAFGRPNTKDRFEQVLAGEDYKTSDGLFEVERDKGKTHLRVCLLCDKSLLDLAYPLATFFEAARQEGASGTLRFISDVSSTDEDGVRLTIRGNTVKKEPIDDCESAVMELAKEIHGLGADESVPPPKGKERVTRINPFTGQAVTVWQAKAPAKKGKKKPKS
jgi:hypothetical protein